MKKIKYLNADKKIFFIMLLFFSEVVLGAEEEKLESGLDSGGFLKRISVIKIIPYNPLADNPNTQEVQEAVPSSGFLSCFFNFSLDEYHREPRDFDPDRVRFGNKIKPDSYVFSDLHAPLLDTYKDHFGFGRNCVYSSEGIDQFQRDEQGSYNPNSHGYYLQTLVKFKEFLGDKRNFLLVRVAMKYKSSQPLQATTQLFSDEIKEEFLFGVFVSGEESKEKHEESIELKKLTSSNPYKRFERINNVIQAIDSEYTGEREDYLNHLEKHDKISFLISSKMVYPKALVLEFPVSGVNFAAVLSQYGQEEQRFDIKRLFSKLQPLHFCTESCMAQRIKEKRYEFLCNLFGDTIVTCLVSRQLESIQLDMDGLGSSQNFKSAHGYIFNQSEQAFLTFLEKGPEVSETSQEDDFMEKIPDKKRTKGKKERKNENVDQEESKENGIKRPTRNHFYSMNPDPDKEQVPASEEKRITVEEMKVYFYSTYDICRYCRGTLAYMLYNGELKKSISSYFKEHVKKELNFKKDPELFAFSNQATDA